MAVRRRAGRSIRNPEDDMPVRGIRGATTAPSNRSKDILVRTKELLTEIHKRNGLQPEDLASIVFTTTPDLNAAFPALAAREMGWRETAMLCAHEIDVAGSVPRCIRVLILWNTNREPADIQHVYLHEAEALRPDLVPPPPEKSPAQAYSTPATIAFQGEHGAFSEEAIILGLTAEPSRVPCRSFQEICLAVATDRVEAGLLPVENSTTGSIHTSYDLLLENDLQIIGELILPVRECAMLPPGVEVENVREVISHPQALEQCARWIASQHWEPVPVYDTAGAARQLLEEKRPDRAAIASETAAKLYGLNILARSIQDIQENYTRFLLLSKENRPIGKPTKTSLIFATSHKPGALHSCLDVLARRGINLNKIESRPDRKKPWHYLFYLDFEGDAADPNVVKALKELKTHTEFIRELGSYPTRTLGNHA
jgi:prephenate dehydratase